ncbi:hypothetical protein PZH35_11765, partial [Veillonella atypica]|uniref:hypothetical protein n=1 Tax=Veillonella atypica TaxID=39777 RepID=UPI0023B0DBAE
MKVMLSFPYEIQQSKLEENQQMIICCLLVCNNGALKKIEQACSNLKRVCMVLLRNSTGLFYFKIGIVYVRQYKTAGWQPCCFILPYIYNTYFK